MRRSTLWLALAALVVSRAVLLVLPIYISDVELYRDWAGLWFAGRRTYAEVGFPYPPLALAPMLLPGAAACDSPAAYLYRFRAGMALIDLASITLVLALGRRAYRFSDEKLALLAILLGVLGGLSPHLLPDRLDAGVALFAVALVAAAVGLGGPARTAALVLLGVTGGLYKIVPALLSPLLLFATKARSPLALLVRAAAALCIPLGTVLAMALLDGTVAPGLLRALSTHGERGVQIESTWAAPWLFLHLLGAPVLVSTDHGAQHLAGLPAGYVEAARVTGFALLAVFGLAQLHRPREALSTTTAALGLLLATQRVLSPQYVLWLAPLLALQIVRDGDRRGLVLALCTFGLTCVEFDGAYWRVVLLVPWAVASLLLRNLALCGLCAHLLVRWWRSPAPPPSRLHSERHGQPAPA